MKLKETNEQKERRTLKGDGQRSRRLRGDMHPNSEKPRRAGKIQIRVKPEIVKETETRMDKSPGYDQSRTPNELPMLATYGLKPMITSWMNGLEVPSSSARDNNLGTVTIGNNHPSFCRHKSDYSA